MSKRYPLLGDKEWLYQKYWVEELSSTAIGEIIECNCATVLRALRRLNIPVRTCSDAKRGRRNPNYGKKGKECPLYGRHPTDQARKNMLKAHKGAPVSEETKRKLSEALKGRVGWSRGKKLSDEHKRKIGEAQRGDKNYFFGKHLTGDENPMYGKKHTDETKAKIRAKRKKQVFPKSLTDIERILKTIFNEVTDKIKYTGNGSFWIKTPEGNINPDFIVIGKKIVVEANGEWWHSRLHNLKLANGRDPNERRKQLKKVGWKLIVFWGEDITRKDAKAFVLSVLRKEKII